jgi:peptidylprolyl isomerase
MQLRAGCGNVAEKGDAMTTATQGNTVKIHYTGTLADGSVFDSSAGHAPLEFKIGGGQVIIGFEEAVIGMSVGESKEVTIPAEKAYGPYQEDLVIKAPREHIPADLDPQVGQRLQMGGTGGEVILVDVTEVTATHVTLDANPPLAGKDLNFQIELVEIA